MGLLSEHARMCRQGGNSITTRLYAHPRQPRQKLLWSPSVGLEVSLSDPNMSTDCAVLRTVYVSCTD
jgi:hypothetical protein